MRKPFFLLLFLLVTALASPARAGEPRPMSVPDLLGARALSLGAYRGLTPGNDGLFTNAAALAAMRRYAVETQYLLDRAGADTALQVYGASVVDSQTAATTGGFGYARVLSGPWIGNLLQLAVALPVTDGLFLGAVGKYSSFDGPANEGVRAGNVDASAFYRAGPVGLGVAGYNLVPAGHRQVQPRALGVGASFGDDRRYHLAVDWRGDYERRGKLTSLYAVGGELLLGPYFPVRAGYLKDETRDAQYWSAGLGLVTTTGLAIDLSYRQRIEAPTERTFGVGLKLFVLSGG